VAVPIYLPRDEAIPAPEVPAEASFTRPFVRDVQVLQREQKSGVPGGLKPIAYLTVAAIAASLLVLIAWALLRLEQDFTPRRRNDFATFPKHLVASRHAESAVRRSGGTKVV
jgi:hypothetical protein